MSEPGWRCQFCGEVEENPHDRDTPEWKQFDCLFQTTHYATCRDVFLLIPESEEEEALRKFVRAFQQKRGMFYVRGEDPKTDRMRPVGYSGMYLFIKHYLGLHVPDVKKEEEGQNTT